MKKLFLPLVLSLVTITTHAYYYLDSNHGSNIAQRVALQTTSSGNYVVNSDCESDDVTCLWGHDGGYDNYQNGAGTHFVEGAGYNGSRGIVVQSINNPQTEYDTEFFVYTPNHVWKTGEKFWFKMKVRADKPADIFPLVHRTPGDYLYYSIFESSTLSVSTEWQEYMFEVEVSSSQNGMQTIDFHLNYFQEANKYYFDDISWELIESAPRLSCPDENHPHMIDLGLPSGTKWACCNVGATTPEGYGGHYAWGETEEKTTYDWSTYIHCDGSEETCHDLGSDIAGTEYDVAHVKWGGSWVIPSLDQNKELIENCSSEWATVNGVNGRIFTGSNGSSIFLPAAGGRWGSSPAFVGNFGDYGSSTQYPSDSNRAYYLYFDSGLVDCWDHSERDGGQSVRPVSVKANSKVYHFDVNNDGEIVLTDALIIINYILGRFDSADQSIVYHLDVNNDGSIELTDALIIINYILGKFEPEGEWYMVAKTSDSEGELVPVREVGSLVAVDDALDFTILGINGNVILEKVLRVDFKPERDLNSSERLSVKKPVSKIPAKVKGVTKSTEGQSSFVVADKKGNNYMVQEVTFRHDKKGTSWMGDGQSGDIRNLQYIARTRTELATVSGEDVMRTLEALSGTGQADPEALAATLNNNPNLEEAFTEDGINVCVKTDREDEYVMYPMYDMSAPFGESILDILPTENNSKALSPIKKASAGSMGKVAIFNYFDGQTTQESYLQQNIIVGYIRSKFEAHDYKVHYFGSKNEGEDKIFTQENFEDVISQSSQYKAIIIMSHGGIGEYRHSYITTRDTPLKDKNAYSFDDPFERKKYRMIPVEETLRDVSENCIVYIGACCGVPEGGFEKYDTAFPNNTKSCAIAWEGRNCIAQAHAALLFHYLLYDGWSVAEALNALPQNDAKYYESQMHFSQNGGIKKLGKEELRPQFSIKYRADVKTEQKYVYKKNDYHGGHNQLTISYRIYSDEYPLACRIYFKNILTGFVHTKKLQIIESNKENVIYYDMSNVYDGCHDIIVEDVRSGKRISLISPAPVLVSENFNKMYALPEIGNEQLPPTILGLDGKSVEEITIPAGSSLTYQIDAYPGHTLSTPCLDTNVVTISLSGNTLTVTGVSEGTTGFGVYDKQNHQMAVVKVTVTPASGGSQSSYLSCPDDHHPHMIDLGLPSGTKWACCNVGADKPEAYGGYYAWGETEEKATYDWSTYIHCDGSEETCHDLGSDIAGTQYDVAHVKWGGSWVMPSYEQQNELRNNCTYEWVTVNGVNGGKFTSKTNGGSVFLPAAGLRWGDSLNYAGSGGHYWSSAQSPSGSYYAYSLGFDSGNADWYDSGRSHGHTVRPVSE